MTIWTTTKWPTGLLRVGDLTCISLTELIDLAARMKAEPDGWADALAGRALACVIDRTSARDRLCTEAAANRLGMLPVPLAGRSTLALEERG
jgi:ornithine carbamoyltransferase